MTRITLTILGETASKANSRKLATVGKEDSRRTIFIKSKKARDYVDDALPQIPVTARQRLEGPVRMALRIWYVNEVSDLDEALILDVLQDRWTGTGKDRQLVQAGVYRNDRQVRERHVYHAIDKRNPRAEIVIEPLHAQQADLLLAPRFVPNEEFFA